MKAQQKRAFTIVELVIVIAVIAILAAILIPTFSGVIQKANQSSDTQLIRNLNTAITPAKALKNGLPTTYDAFMEAKANGYDVSTIVAKSGYNIAYDIDEQQFVLLDMEKDEYLFPLDAENNEIKTLTGSQEKLNLFVVAKDNDTMKKVMEKGYSIYWKNDAAPTTTTVTVGFDAGECTAIAELAYVQNTKEQDVVIRTNGGSLTINAPADTVKHYGEANVVDIQEVAATSYHEYGDVLTAKIAKGRLVITEEAEIGLIKAVATNDVFTDIKIGLVGNAELPTVTRDDVALDSETEAGHYTQLVLEVQKLASETTAPTASNTEYVWIDINIDGNGKTTKTEVASSKTELTESTKIQDTAISNSVTEITKVSNAGELDAALAANKKYIMFTADIPHENQVELTYSVTIDGDGHKLTSTGTAAANELIDAYNTPGWKFYHGAIDVIESNINVKITNIELINDRKSGTGIALGRSASHVNIEVENVYISAKQYNFYTHVGSTYQNATFKYVRFDPSSYNAMYWRGAKGKFVAYNTEFTSLNSSSAVSNAFTTFCIERPLLVDGEIMHCSENEFTFTNCKFNRVQTGTALQTLMMIGSEKNKVYFNNTEFKNSGIITIAGKMYGNLSDNTTEIKIEPSKIFVDGKEELPVNAGYREIKKSAVGDGRIYWPEQGVYSGTFDFDISLVTEDEESIIKEGYHVQNNGNGTWTVVAD